ncbi:MAG: 60 kDa inner rane insertion protein [Marmoricola sp.]|nr:60 kDa inner rane insertion protein [Marmoricola sp.]
MGFLGQIGHFIITPLYYLVSAVLLGWHHVFSLVFGSASGASWALSIVFLTLTIRVCLIPLFVKQIKSSRNMQLLQPKVKELQKKYGHDRERLTQETMALYKETGTNPFSSCLPLIVQMPIFLSLFRILSKAAKSQGHGLLTKSDAIAFAHAPFFGGTLSSSFVKSDGHEVVKIIAIFLVLAMTLTTFLTQRQLMSKNMPDDALSGPYAQQQKMLLYVLPLVFAVGGIAFPIGVLMYWTTSNLWTMGQQFYVIRNNPAPNTEAFRAKQRRDSAKGIVKSDPVSGSTAIAVESVEQDRRPAQRQQPRKQTREQRRAQAPKNPSPNGDSIDQGEDS